MKLIKMVLSWFKPKPKVLSFPGGSMGFYSFVRDNYKTKSYEQGIREYFKPLIVPIETLEVCKPLWDLVVFEMERRYSERNYDETI